MILKIADYKKDILVEDALHYRNEILIPFIESGGKKIDLDGTRGYSSAYLKILFSDLPFDDETLFEIEILTKDQSLEYEIFQYIDDISFTF